MSSLPSISHHLFVAAVAHEQRPQAKPPPYPDQGSSDTQTSAVELPTPESNFDCDAVTPATLLIQT